MVDLINSITGEYCKNCRAKEICTYTCGRYSQCKVAIHVGIQQWLSSFDSSSATECFTAVNLLKQRLEGEDEYNSRN